MAKDDPAGMRYPMYPLFFKPQTWQNQKIFDEQLDFSADL
jgi:hypothetical protein